MNIKVKSPTTYGNAKPRTKTTNQTRTTASRTCLPCFDLQVCLDVWPWATPQYVAKTIFLSKVMASYQAKISFVFLENRKSSLSFSSRTSRKKSSRIYTVNC